MPTNKPPTNTCLVEQALSSCDDFLSQEMLCRLTGRTLNQVSAALCHLRSRRVVDVVVQPDGKGWWFYLGPDNDSRAHKVFERRLEEPGSRKPRRKAAKEKQ